MRSPSETKKPGAPQHAAIALPADRPSPAESGAISLASALRPFGVVFRKTKNNAGSRAGSLIANTMGGSALSILHQTYKEDRREEP